MNTFPTSWKIHTDVPTIWESLIKACENAKYSIDIEQYIFIDDIIGNRFLEVLSRKASEGVKVRLLCDTAGSFPFYGSTMIFGLEKAGVEVVFFNTFVPVIFRSHFTWWFFRDHRKLAIIDGLVAFTGSFSIWDVTKNWRDTAIEIKGEVVEEMQESFNAMWNRAFRKPVPEFPKNLSIGEEGFNFVSNTPRPHQRELYYRIVEAIRGAKSHIYITVPYFTPDRRIVRILKLAKKRGVDVRIILPEKCDSTLLQIAAMSHFDDLLKAGIKIYIYKPSFIHSKSIIVDSHWATVGSLNLDNISLVYNFEANLISTDKKFVNDISEIFIKDLEKSEEIKLSSWKERDFDNKVLEWLIKFIRKFL